MSDVIFGGGHVDLTNLLATLDGRPFQAEFEEVFIPRSGGLQHRRSGCIYVDGRGRVRCEVEEDGRPRVVSIQDFERGVIIGGVADDPDSWARAQMPFPRPEVLRRGRPQSVEALPGDELVEGLPCLREEFNGPDGARSVLWRSWSLGLWLRIEYLYRLRRLRHDEPPAELFPI